MQKYVIVLITFYKFQNGLELLEFVFPSIAGQKITYKYKVCFTLTKWGQLPLKSNISI